MISGAPTYYGALEVGSVRSHMFVVTNTGLADVSLGTVSSLALGLSAPFSLVGGSCASGATIPANDGTYTLEVTFSPMTLGAALDSLTVSYKLAAGAAPDASVVLAMAGEGLSMGLVSNFSVSGISSPYGIAAGPDGNLWFTNNGNSSIGRITPAGVVSSFTDPSMYYLQGIAAGPDGNLWFINTGTPPNHLNSIGRITPAGVVSSFTDPSMYYLQGIAAGPDGNLWCTNYNDSNNSIVRITPAGVVSSFTDTGIDLPSKITAGPDGGMWFLNGNDSIGRINLAKLP